MNNISKISISIFILFIISTKQVTGQDSLTALRDSWLQLKTQLLRKTDIAINLAKYINTSQKADRDLAEKVKSTASDLAVFIDSSRGIDSSTIRATWQKNINLTQALSGILVVLIKNPKLKTQNELEALQMHLEGIENRIEVAKRNYNDICVEYKRQDLLFGSGKKEKSPKVSFD